MPLRSTCGSPSESAAGSVCRRALRRLPSLPSVHHDAGRLRQLRPVAFCTREELPRRGAASSPCSGPPQEEEGREGATRQLGIARIRRRCGAHAGARPLRLPQGPVGTGLGAENQPTAKPVPAASTAAVVTHTHHSGGAASATSFSRRLRSASQVAMRHERRSPRAVERYQPPSRGSRGGASGQVAYREESKAGTPASTRPPSPLAAATRRATSEPVTG